MASAWQTLEEAALTLGISSRTLHRRIAKGEVQTRLEHGRREVLVMVPEPEPVAMAAVTDHSMPHVHMSSDIGECVHDSDRAVMADMADDVGQTMLALHEDRIRRTDLAIMAYQQSVTAAAMDARRSRTGSRIAWSTAALATVALVACLTWATHRLTRAEADVRYLSQQLETAAARADSKADEAEALRQQAEAARIAAARAEGELSATRNQLASTAPPAVVAADTAAPTTQPAPLPLHLFTSLQQMLSER